MDRRPVNPNTRVLAIASHVVFGHVGNTMVLPVLQSLGYQVSALNTVQYSNHAGYRAFRGIRTPPETIRELYTGLTEAGVDDFDVLLTGYAPGKEGVQAVGEIARKMKAKKSGKGVFWVLDPVMGDSGRLYVDEDVVPVYRSLIGDADLVVPNLFELELLAETKITTFPSVYAAISTLHQRYRIPHIVVTSVTGLPSSTSKPDTLTIIASSCTTTVQPRLFELHLPLLPYSFAGTGDLFAALLLGRFREECGKVGVLGKEGWRCADELGWEDLPLRKAVEGAGGVVREVLGRVVGGMPKGEDLEGRDEKGERDGVGEGEKEKHLRRTRNAEISIVKFLDCLAGSHSDNDDCRAVGVDWKG